MRSRRECQLDRRRDPTQLARVVVHPARGIRSFIHNEDLEQSWYYWRFEVLNEEKSGWFYPDPATVTPYIVITTQP